MRTSDAGIDLIKRFEGLVEPGSRITEDDAETLLIYDLMEAERVVERYVHQIHLSQPRFDALVSLAYNIGEAQFRGSTAVKRTNKGDYLGAAEALTWWNKATVNGKLREVPGLTRRRAAEKALYLTPHGVAETPNNPARPGFAATQATNVMPSVEEAPGGFWAFLSKLFGFHKPARLPADPFASNQKRPRKRKA